MDRWCKKIYLSSTPDKLLSNFLLLDKIDLMLNEVQSEGLHVTNWNAAEMAAGVYFINLEVLETDGDKHQKTQKVILLK